LFLGTGPNDEYLLDICPHSGSKCITEPTGRHVGCCCGVVPAADLYGISANNSPSRSLKDEEPIKDVCATAYQQSYQRVNRINNETLELPEGQKILNRYMTTESGLYQDYYTSCDRRLQEREIPQSSLEMRFARHDNGTEVPRNLQDQNFLSCNRPTSPSTPLAGQTLQVAFTDKTQKDICQDIEGYSDDKLAQMCNEFCEGTHSSTVPFLLGSLRMGFSHTAMDELCLQPADTKYSKEFVDECQRKGALFRRVQAATASFLGSLKELEHAKLLYVTQLQSKTATFGVAMKESLKDITKKYVKSTMAEPFKEAIKTNVDSILLANSASEDVKNEAKKVTERGGNLLRELGEVLPEIEAFLNTCNDVVTGVGSRGEYLLDLCAQQGQYCIEKTFSQHAGCCCGYNPISSLGMGSTIITKATIKGTRANPAWEPRSAEHRRLQEDSIAYNICGEASKATKESINVYETKLKNVSNGEALLVASKQNIKEKYPAYGERCKEYMSPEPSKPSPGGSDRTTTAASRPARTTTAARSRRRRTEASKCYQSFPGNALLVAIIIVIAKHFTALTIH